MRKSLACLIKLLSVSATTLARRRMITNLADGHLKSRFLNAAYIWPHSAPLCTGRFIDDPRKNSKAPPVALAWWSTDVVPIGEDFRPASPATLTVQSATRAVRVSATKMAKLFLNPSERSRRADAK